MKTYKISTTEKKSIEEIEQWGSTEVSFDISQWWRWGYVIVEVMNDEEFDVEAIIENKDGFIATNYNIVDKDLSDGVSLNFDTYGDDDLEEQVSAMWDDGGYVALEETGFSCEDITTIFHGKLEVELLEESDDPPAEKGTWPF